MAGHNQNKRKRQFVDSEVQTALLWQCALHWGLFGFGTFIIMFLLHVASTPAHHTFMWHVERLWNHYGAIVLVMLALLPIFVLDMVKMTHRFVGPIIHLRKAIRGLARGERVEPIKFRKGDFWLELADEFNAILKVVQSPVETEHTLDEKRPEPATQPEPVLVSVED